MPAKPKQARSPRAPRKPSAKASRDPRGNLTLGETTALYLEAKDAFNAQIELANIPPETDFKAWRGGQLMALCERPGISALDRKLYNKAFAHFAILAGHEEKAMEHILKDGQAKDNGPEDDQKPKRRQLAHVIMENLRAHMRLATISPAALAAETESTAEYERLRAARAAILAHPKGAFTEGFIVFLARDKTERKDLTLGPDIEAGLADRCTVEQLSQLLFTLRNRISTREGRAKAEKRAPGYAHRKAVKKAKAAALDTPEGTASRIAKPSDEDPF